MLESVKIRPIKRRKKKHIRNVVPTQDIEHASLFSSDREVA